MADQPLEYKFIPQKMVMPEDDMPEDDMPDMEDKPKPKKPMTKGSFSGYGAWFGNVDQGDDVIWPGAFHEWCASKEAPAMLLNHDSWEIPPGVWTAWREDEKGLSMAGLLHGVDTPHGQYVHSAVKSGAIRGLSIGYQSLGHDYSKGEGDRMIRNLRKLWVYEVSLVTMPMNKLATITDAKSQISMTPRALEAVLRDAGLTKQQALRAVANIKAANLRRDAGGKGVDAKSVQDLVNAIRQTTEQLRNGR